MASSPWQASPQFWIEKIRHIQEVLTSMREYGGFDLVCDHWSTAAKRECVTELDRLTAVLTEWKAQLQDELSDSTQPMDPILKGPGSSQKKPTKLRTASAWPAPRLLSLRSGERG